MEGGVRRVTMRLHFSQKNLNGHQNIIFFMSCQKFIKIWKTFLQEYVICLKSDILEFCPEFDIKTGKVNFDLAWYN
jgi:hypothetical protein